VIDAKLLFKVLSIAAYMFALLDEKMNVLNLCWEEGFITQASLQLSTSFG